MGNSEVGVGRTGKKKNLFTNCIDILRCETLLPFIDTRLCYSGTRTVTKNTLV